MNTYSYNRNGHKTRVKKATYGRYDVVLVIPTDESGVYDTRVRRVATLSEARDIFNNNCNWMNKQAPRQWQVRQSLKKLLGQWATGGSDV